MLDQNVCRKITIVAILGLMITTSSSRSEQHPILAGIFCGVGFVGLFNGVSKIILRNSLTSIETAVKKPKAHPVFGEGIMSSLIGGFCLAIAYNLSQPEMKRGNTYVIVRLDDSLKKLIQEEIRKKEQTS